jgi:hypothetical protein
VIQVKSSQVKCEIRGPRASGNLIRIYAGPVSWVSNHNRNRCARYSVEASRRKAVCRRAAEYPAECSQNGLKFPTPKERGVTPSIRDARYCKVTWVTGAPGGTQTVDMLLSYSFTHFVPSCEIIPCAAMHGVRSVAPKGPQRGQPHEHGSHARTVVRPCAQQVPRGVSSPLCSVLHGYGTA